MKTIGGIEMQTCPSWRRSSAAAMPSATAVALCWRVPVREESKAVDLPVLASVELKNNAFVFNLNGFENKLVLRSMEGRASP